MSSTPASSDHNGSDASLQSSGGAFGDLHLARGPGRRIVSADGSIAVWFGCDCVSITRTPCFVGLHERNLPLLIADVLVESHADMALANAQ